MKLHMKTLVRAIAAALSPTVDRTPVVSRGRARVHDVAFQFRMTAGFPGEVNRMHPASIEPALQNASTPGNAFGQMLLADTAGATNTVRRFGAGDTAVTIPYGMLVRSFPTQAPAGSSNAQQAIGAAAPPSTGVVDVLRRGYGLVQLNTGSTSPTKGATVYIWCAATSGNHIQGGFETAASGGNTAALAGNVSYNGPADANGVVEVCIN